MSHVHSWPNAILHCDADCFYLSCEYIRQPHLKGKPAIVTSRLGKIALTKSYEAKAKGVKTGMPLWEAQKLCPDIIVVPCDFEYYNDMSARMFAILRKWTPDVEVYSVDEAFLDIKGFRRLYKMSYPQIAQAIKDQIKQDLDLTVSVGLSVTKTLAKMCSDKDKPDGMTVISWKDIPKWLPRFHISEVPGFGRNTVPMLEKMGMKTCADFVNITQPSVRSLLHRPGVDLWRELQGEQVFKVEKTFAPNKIITRTSSFEPFTADQTFIWSHTIRQLERAIDALNYDHQLTREVSLYLRGRDFKRHYWSYQFAAPTKSFEDLLNGLKSIWRQHFPRGQVMRSSGVTLTKLSHDAGPQLNLFEDPGLIIRRDELEGAKYSIKERYGRLSIRSASSLRLKKLGPNKKKPLKAKAFNVEW